MSTAQRPSTRAATSPEPLVNPHRRLHTLRRGHRDQGFTLIELLVVAIIVGLLAAIAVPVYLNQRHKAADSSLRADIKQMALFQESYIVDNPGSPGFAGPTGLISVTPGTTWTVGRNVFKGSPGNWVNVRVDASNYAGGYCIQADSYESSRGIGAYITYNSTTGGFKPGWSANGVC